MKLRGYQEAAVEAVYDYLRNRDDNPVAVLPTGAGKSLVLAKIASDAVSRWGGRVLVSPYTTLSRINSLVAAEFHAGYCSVS